MNIKALIKILPVFIYLLIFRPIPGRCQAELPPVQPWKGKSESLVLAPTNKLATPIEKSDFHNTPDYRETRAWLEDLAKASPWVSLKTIGETPNGYEIIMVTASRENPVDPDKPLLLVQCGIHAGEIDGKDAGMILLRDIVYRGRDHLLDNVNLLFIPILNIDGHERSAPYNRINQNGPDNMGWRTNALNQNLNRDYAKLDTKEIRAVVDVVNQYHPDLYLDIHVTDGADYQYDVTYGYINDGYSPHISKWFSETFRPYTDSTLVRWGHVPGPLLFAANGNDFSDGNLDFTFEPDFSHSYGDLRHLPAILVENHSLKPYKRRVLGTYVFIETAMKLLAADYSDLRKAASADCNAGIEYVPFDWTFPSSDTSKNYYFPYNVNTSKLIPYDSMQFLGIQYINRTSNLTGEQYIQWTGIPDTFEIMNYRNNKVAGYAVRPVAYYIPGAWEDIIQRLKIHGIKMSELSDSLTVQAEQYKVTDYSIARTPFEGHYRIRASFNKDTVTITYPPGTIRIDPGQPLGDLAMVLLEPSGQSSFFRWGFFNSILNRTEYVEEYVMEPYAEKMFRESKEIRDEFEKIKKQDPEKLDSPGKILNWFYSRTPYADKKYLVYPVTREIKPD